MQGFARLWVKEEGVNPTGSFKARGLAAAVTRATAAGATRFVVPTAGNAGIALAAYAARAGVRARVVAPETTPATILAQIRSFGAELVLVDGHIGDCGQAARADRCTPWPEPRTIAAGLRVPSPLGDRLMLRALRESNGGAVAVTDEALSAAARELQTVEGIDAAPEGGAAWAAAIELKRTGAIRPEERVVVFNTGAGWLYRS